MTQTDIMLVLGITLGLIAYHQVVRPQLLNAGLIP